LYINHNASKKIIAGLSLLMISGFLYSNEDQNLVQSEVELMEELELELHNLIKWECSDDNPFQGKFDLQCNIMIVNASEIKNN
jgi:hypothetical protein